jgi:tetratricopeptide (TPR) repeat protein
MKARLGVGLAVLLFITVARAGFAQSAAESAAQAGNSLMGEKKYCQALAQYRIALTTAPSASALLYNAGFAAYLCHDLATATDLWERLRRQDAEDWQVRAKLIQAYQALEKLSERDAVRSELFDMWKRGGNQDLAGQLEYCRDRFDVGGEKVMAYEHFELKGDRALRYVFSVMDESGEKEKYRISLGSYELDNRMWHEMTKPRPPDDQRLFHLDGYYQWGHATYGMYTTEPSYDETRNLVIAILEKKLDPVSTSTRSK